MARRKVAAQTILASTVAGTAASVVLAVITSITVTESSQIAFLVGCSGTLLGAILGVGVTVNDRLDELDRRRIEAAKLRSLAEMPEAELEVVELTRCLKHVYDAESQYASLLWHIAVNALQDAREQMTTLAGGRFTCSRRQEVYVVREALTSTRTEVCAVAARGPVWWVNPEADGYWRVYAEAAKRIPITRVFLADAQTPELRSVLDRHAALGMRTFSIPIQYVPAALRVPIVVFDDGLLHHSYLDGTIDDRREVEFSTDSREIAKARQDFRLIMSLPQVAEWQPSPAVGGTPRRAPSAPADRGPSA